MSISNAGTFDRPAASILSGGAAGILAAPMEVAGLGSMAVVTDAALAAIVDLGGSVVMPAEDTPYGATPGRPRTHRSAIHINTAP